jgi:mannosyltransferase
VISARESWNELKNRSIVVSVILLLLLVGLALALRFYRLDAQSLWYDEGFSVYLARMDLPDITARTAADIQPPLYYYLLHGWIDLLGDDSESALRGLSLLFGVLTVPLMYAVAWQLFRRRSAGLLAALFVAVSPLDIWYGQEARMYTLLTFLCLLSSYLLLLVIRARRTWQIVVLWIGYTLANVAALYTHYFAFFVLAFQAAYLLLVWASRGFRPLRLFVGGLASGLAILLAYLPWLPYLVARYGADLSYWPGQLKLPEVLLDIGVFFVGGESISEPMGVLLGSFLGLVFLLCLLVLLVWAAYHSRPLAGRSTLSSAAEPSSSSPPNAPYALPRGYHQLLFLLLYLLLPPALILALSYDSPKFNARYVMLSQPALLLLCAGGLAILWDRRSGHFGSVARSTLTTVSLIFVLGVSFYADYNLYADPTFARADFRGVAGYIEKHIQPDETVILVSGHMYPVFDYYAPGLQRHLLPDSPTLDTNETLDYGIAADLIGWLADRGGVWVVLWQDEVVDPAGYLTSILDEVGEEQPLNRSFSQVKLVHYRLSPDAQISEQPAIAHPADFNFGDQLRLLGYTQSGEREVILFWEAIQPLDQDYHVSLVLRDPEGQSWGNWDGRPTAYLFPTDRWRVGQIVPGRCELAPLPGTPPGDYGLEVGVYTEADPVGLDVLDAAGAPQGKRAMLGAVQLSVPAVTMDEVQPANPALIDMGGGLILLGWDLDRAEAQPGDRLLLTLIWSVESQPQADYQVRLFVTDSAGQTLDAGSFSPTNEWHPTSIWLPEQAWRGQSTFRLPIAAQPGGARLSVQLTGPDGTPLSPAADLAAIQVLPTSRLFSPPHPQSPRETNFGDTVALLGADLAPDPVAPGDALAVTLYWQALADTDVPYTVFVHLLGPDGQMVAGQDSQPVDGTRPTTGWVPGEYVADLHEVPIPAGLAPGDYVIEVGVYDAGVPAMPRLPIVEDEEQLATDRVIFGPVQVQ